MVSGVEGVAAPGEGDIFNTTKNIVRQEFVHASKSLQQRDIEYQVSQTYTLYLLINVLGWCYLYMYDNVRVHVCVLYS